MTKFSRLFVVFDPTQEEQPALLRAADIAVETSASVQVYACIYSDIKKPVDQSAQIEQLLGNQQAVLDRAIGPLRDRGIEVNTQIEWDKDWYHGAVCASIESDADIVLKSSYKHFTGKRKLNKTSDWTLMRKCQCPVLLVKEEPSKRMHKVLAAVDICAKKESYERLNENVIELSRLILDRNCADVHFVNAFQDFRGVPDRQALIQSCGVDSSKIHIKLGKPEKVIVEYAKKLNVSLVVVGNSSRSGLPAALHGNTVEKVLDKLECDVLSIP